MSRGTNECAVFTLGNDTDTSLFSAINELIEGDREVNSAATGTIFICITTAVTLSILGVRYLANKIKVHINSDYHDDSDQHNICLGQIEDQEALSK